MKFDSYIANMWISSDYFLGKDDYLNDYKQLKYQSNKYSYEHVNLKGKTLTEEEWVAEISKDWDNQLLKHHGTLDFQCLDSDLFEFTKDDLMNETKVNEVCKALNSINDNIKPGQIIIVLVAELLLYSDNKELCALRSNLINGNLSEVIQTSYYDTLLHNERHSFKINSYSKAVLIFGKKSNNISLINVMEERMDESCYMLADINCQSIVWDRDRFNDVMFCLLPSACLLDDVAKAYNVKLGDICDIKQGSILTRFVDSIPTSDYDAETDGKLFYPVRGKDIEGMEISRDILPVIAKKDKKIDHFLLKEGDILVTIKSSNIKAGIVSDGEDRDLLASSNCLIVKTKEGFSSEMVLAYLNSDCFKMYVNTNYINKYLKMLTVPFLQNAPISANIEVFELTNNDSVGNNIKYQRNSIKKYKKMLEESKNEYENGIDEIFNSKLKEIAR